MTQIFDDTRAIPVTVIKAGPCFVAQVKTEEKDGYSAVQLAFGATRPNGLTKPEAGSLRQARRPDRPARRRDPHGRRRVVRAGPGAPGRRVRGRRARRRRRRLQGQGLRRRDEAPRVQRPVEQPRDRAQAPLAGRDRRVRDPVPRVQGHADGGTDGQRARDRAEPRGRPRRRRTQPAAPAGRDPGSRGRPGDGPLGREGPAAKGGR